jgi:hypothetical protein
LAFTEEEKQKILGAIRTKVPQMGKCPICGNPHWTLADGFVSLPIQGQIGGIVLGGPTLPCVPIICTNCGNTALLNAMLLGLKDVLGTKTES